MARLINKEQTYKLKLEINKDEVLKDIREIKKEVKEVVKECTFEINKLELKRKDILVVKANVLMTAEYRTMIKESLEKELHRRVLVIDNTIDIDHVISYRKK